MLQWKGVHSGSSFGWETIRWADTPADYQMDPIYVSNVKDVRFRVCNMNINTGYVGTCGSS